MAIEQRPRAQREAADGLEDQLLRGRQELEDVRREAIGIVADVRSLVSKEFELAKAEVAEAASFATRTMVLGAVAAVFAVLALVFVSLTVLLALATFMPLWAAALITTAALGLLTVASAMVAKRTLAQISVMPQRTIASLGEDVKWVRSQLNFKMR